ncbi:hypothetical protein ON010_g12061 [Phytophthora cinnamomi]|nr:hypothetical protein ON010_g12061 [Phytophthora cinnamomi]
MSRAWGLRVDPLVPEENRWHSSHHGTTVTTPDAIGDAFVATLRDAALEAGDGLDASVIAFCGRQVVQQLVDYEREPRLLVKLADTGRVVTVLLQASRTAAEVAPARDDDRDEEEGEDNDEDKDEEGREHVSKLTLWRRTLAEERVRRMEDIYEPLLSDDTRLMEEAGDEMQQQEILTLMKNDVEIYGAVLTEREIDVIVKLYSRIVRRSGVVVGTIPRWFATTTSLWPDVAKTVMTDTGEDFACQISIWRTLRHPNVLRLYGACHVGQPFVIHEAHNAISTEVLWRDLLGLAAGLGYVHERGFVYRELTMGTFRRLSSERRLVVTGMGLMRASGDEQGGERDRAANVMSFGLALLDILQRTRGDGGDQVEEKYFVNRQLPNSKPSHVTDAEWELVCSMCSVIFTNRPSMKEVVWGVRKFITQAKRNPWRLPIPGVAVGTYVCQPAGLLISELLEAVCEEVADNGFLFRSVSDRLVNIYQQLEEHHESVPRVFVEDFCLVLCDFYRYLKKISDALSVDSLDSMDTLFSDNPFKFHHYLDRLMYQAPGLLHMSQLNTWNHLLQEEIRQAHEESMAAWKRMNAYELSGDVIDTSESSDEGQDAWGLIFWSHYGRKNGTRETP